MKADWIGIDFGANLAGTTVVSWQEDGELQLTQSEKKKSADQFVISQIEKLQPGQIFIDAPLSLPSVYVSNGDDFFYRKADREIQAMSPMFLGGLTARAMRLRLEVNQVWPTIKFFESYPGGLAEQLDMKKLRYKKGSSPTSEFLRYFQECINCKLEIKSFTDWHRIDAALAWQIGYRLHNQSVEVFGEEDEGLIYV